MHDPTTLCSPGPNEKFSINIINVVVASLSLIGSILTIISYSIKKYRKYREIKAQQQQNQSTYNHFQNNLLQTPNGNSSFSSYSTNSGGSPSKSNSPSSKLPDLIFFLAISDFFTALCIIISQAYLIGNIKSYSAQTLLSNYLLFSPCILFRGIIQFFFLSTFFWTTCIAYYLYHQLSSPDKEKHLLYIFHLVSYGIPLIIVMGLGLSNSFIEDPSTGWCESGKEFEFIFWFLPLFLCVALCAFYYIRLKRLFRLKFEYRLQVNERLKQLDNTISRRLTLYIVVFIVCWTPDIIQHFISFFSTCNFYPLMLVQNVLSPAQGIFNFFVFSITNKVVTINAPNIAKESKRLLSSI
ncbi:hypothetical protein DLAC_08548 [Tieghemostelium lacteum]|uniref:G-protein coupled receptors family 2 profile 2 domain-containing protein n=1 Tax=Tieghemostelium lacteum TaxID=361077 RepID=A0A151Z7S1_TIELA|nr:hypothetical protein DLAC_08548 [Tieghemostelium lacteum]|eukprot:KYQ89978.1 hypothetical protein DLAC_08548 [Tieghemostelium lacteum]